MPATAALLLVFVAAGLLLLAGVGIGRWCGRPPSENEAAVMAAMTGIALGFLFIVMPVIPLAVGAALSILGVALVALRSPHGDPEA
jgi:hypothetical protein